MLLPEKQDEIIYFMYIQDQKQGKQITGGKIYFCLKNILFKGHISYTLRLLLKLPIIK